MYYSVDESRFEVLGRLGRGGTAEVLRVAVRGSSRQAALKCPLPAPSSPDVDFQKLAAREGKLIGGLGFPGLVRLLEVPAEYSDSLLLELCEGPTLDGVGKVSDLRLALNLLSAIAIDLHFLHLKGIIHGDFKPHNVFLPKDWESFGDGTLQYAKLSDFSLGRFESEPESARAGMGTVGYMAPETIVAGKSSHRSDLFAYGVTAYQLLTGIHPFMQGGSDPMRISADVCELTPDPIDKFRPDLSPGLIELISSLLAKDEKNRPETALAVCRQLAEAGATYPYNDALPPKHVLAGAQSYDEAKSICVSLTDKQSAWLDIITGMDVNKLRLAMSANFAHGTLRLSDTGYQFAPNIYWPSGLRRRELAQFLALPLSAKRRAILKAVHLQNRSTGQAEALTNLLRPLLRPQTVSRLSRRYAPRAEQDEQYLMAAQLYVQAGDVERADRCAYQAAATLRGEHRAPEAVRCITAVLDLAALQKRQADVLSLMMLKGDILKESGQVDEAYETYQQIIQVYDNLPADKLLAETYKDLGDLYKMKQDSAAGLEALKKALEISRHLDDVLEVSRTLNNIGNSFFYAGNFAQALTHYREALHLQRRLDASAEVASTLTNMGSIYCMKGRFSRGVLLLRTSLEIKKELGNISEIARSYNNLGYAYFLVGQYDLAFSSVADSLGLNRRIGSKKEILVNLENLANFGLTAGFLRDSLEYLNEGLSLASDLGDKPHQALFYHLLSTAYLRMGRLTEAQRTLDAATAMLPGIDDPQLPCNIELTAGGIRLAVGDEDDARRHWQAAYELAMKSGNKPLALNAQVELLRLGADPTLVQAVEQTAVELDLTRERQLISFNCAEYLLDHGLVDEADQFLGAIRQVLPQLKKDIDSARLHCIAAELLASRREDNEAAGILTKGQQQAQLSGLVPEMARCLTMAAQLEGRAGNFEGAFTKYRQALQLYKQVADTLGSDTDRSFFQGKRSIRFLVEEIRRLGKLLGQKQRAG